jgi:hypothetical protein
MNLRPLQGEVISGGAATTLIAPDDTRTAGSRPSAIIR